MLVEGRSGLRLRHLEEEGEQDPPDRRRQGADGDEAHGEARNAASKGRSGRTFSAKLALEQGEDGKWRVEFDEEWARNGANRTRRADVVKL